MQRKESEAVPEGNGPVRQDEEFGSGQPAPVDPFQLLKEILDRRIDVITRLPVFWAASQPFTDYSLVCWFYSLPFSCCNYSSISCDPVIVW